AGPAGEELGAQPLEDPLRVCRREIHAAVALFLSEAVVPVGAMKRDAGLKKFDPGHALHEVLTVLVALIAHVDAGDFGPHRVVPAGGTVSSARADERRVHGLRTTVGDENLLAEIDVDPLRTATFSDSTGLGCAAGR